MKFIYVILIGLLFSIIVQADDKQLLGIANQIPKEMEKDCNKNPSLAPNPLAGDVMMAVHGKDLGSITSGGFKNMFETGKGAFFTGKNLEYKKNRMKAEDDLICEVLGKKNNNPSLRPKYAFFMPKSKNEGSQKARMDPKYGDVYVVFKDDVKKRSTLTLGDSLNNYSENSNPSDPWKMRKHLQGNFGYIQSFSFYQKKLEELSIDTPYYEVQIYGPLKIEDVAEFRVKKEDFNKYKNAFQNIKVPIYEIKNGSYIFERGNKLK